MIPYIYTYIYIYTYHTCICIRVRARVHVCTSPRKRTEAARSFAWTGLISLMRLRGGSNSSQQTLRYTIIIYYTIVHVCIYIYIYIMYVHIYIYIYIHVVLALPQTRADFPAWKRARRRDPYSYNNIQHIKVRRASTCARSPRARRTVLRRCIFDVVRCEVVPCRAV